MISSKHLLKPWQLWLVYLVTLAPLWYPNDMAVRFISAGINALIIVYLYILQKLAVRLEEESRDGCK